MFGLVAALAAVILLSFRVIGTLQDLATERADVAVEQAIQTAYEAVLVELTKDVTNEVTIALSHDIGRIGRSVSALEDLVVDMERWLPFP